MGENRMKWGAPITWVIGSLIIAILYEATRSNYGVSYLVAYLGGAGLMWVYMKLSDN